jgi:hypothetical protein
MHIWNLRKEGRKEGRRREKGERGRERGKGRGRGGEGKGKEKGRKKRKRILGVGEHNLKSALFHHFYFFSIHKNIFENSNNFL